MNHDLKRSEPWRATPRIKSSLWRRRAGSRGRALNTMSSGSSPWRPVPSLSEMKGERGSCVSLRMSSHAMSSSATGVLVRLRRRPPRRLVNHRQPSAYDGLRRSSGEACGPQGSPVTGLEARGRRAWTTTSGSSVASDAPALRLRWLRCHRADPSPVLFAPLRGEFHENAPRWRNPQSGDLAATTLSTGGERA